MCVFQCICSIYDHMYCKNTCVRVIAFKKNVICLWAFSSNLHHLTFCSPTVTLPLIPPLSLQQLYHPLPQGFSFSEAKVYIETLPAQDDPEVFGMNENAEKAYLVSQTDTFIETILSVQPRIMKGLIGYVMVIISFIT